LAVMFALVAFVVLVFVGISVEVYPKLRPTLLHGC